MKTYTLSEAKDLHIGKIGTPERDAYEAAVEAARIGAVLRLSREQQHLTQEELGQRAGMARSRVCRIERGGSASLSAVCRLFRAMNLSVSLDVPGVGKVAL